MGGGLHDVMTTILVDGHTPLCLTDAGPRWQWGSVGWVEPTPSTKQLLRWSEALAGIARTGLGFTESLYEQERFEEILRVAADIRVAADDGSEGAEDADGLVEEWLGSVGKGVPGYVTPKVAVGAAVGNDKGEILLVQRADSGRLALPHRLGRRRLLGRRGGGQGGRGGDRHRGRGGPADRRARRPADRHQPHPPLLPGVPVSADRGRAQGPSPRVRRRGLVPPRQAPLPLAGAERWGQHVFAALRGEPIEVLYDSVRSPIWRGDPDKL